MRSSVSYMLSQGPGDPIMAHPDYEQHHYHHGCLLILVRGIGPLKPRSLQRVFERVQRVNNVKIADSSEVTRDIWVRYIRDHPVENNDWGDFQTHRRLLGLITFGKFEAQNELNELCRVHESLKVKYTNTLFDSRCLLFGPTTEELQKLPQQSGAGGGEKNGEDKGGGGGGGGVTIEKCFQTPSYFKSRAFFYAENDPCLNLETKISEFITSLYYILELKRLEKTREKLDKAPLLLAPFEKKDFVGLDLESRNNKKRCIGRMTKHLGDLTLQAGLVAESLNFFHAASETLRAISDSLWLGAANEGLCAASAILLYPNFRYTMSIQRNSSLQENSSSPQKFNLARNQLYTGSYNGDSSTLKHKKSEMVINLNASDTASILTVDKTSASSNSSASSISSSLSSASGGSGTASGSSSDSGTTPVTKAHNASSTAALKFPTNMLQPDEIPVRYRDAIINYSKYRNAGIIETEAALKAARICIEQGKNLDVAMFLQNVLYINLNMSEQQRVRRFEVLTDLYQKIGYNRKAAFCQRLAAWRHVAQSNSNPDWGQSYRLMLESFPGHKLALEPNEVLENNTGWPVLQIDLLQQLVGTARRLGQSALATRHMTFLLQTMWKNLTPQEQKEMALQLQNLSAQCEGAPVPLVLENGIVIPPANLTDLPRCTQLQVKDLAPHQKPVKIVVSKVDSGPFLFTPIHFSSLDRRGQERDDRKIAFNWVQHDVCEVNLTLINPLPFELLVTDMRLLTTGVVFEAFPQTVTLQSNVPTSVSLHGTSIECGELEIQGYSTHTLGVKSNCRLKHMQHRKERNLPPCYRVKILPALPKLEAKTSLPQTATFSGMPNADFVTTSASITLYNGERSECTITLTNTSNIAIEYVDATFHSALEASLQQRIFQLASDELNRKLPIAPGESIDFKLVIYGEADFLGALTAGPGQLLGGGLQLNPDGMNSAGPQSLTVSHGGGGGGGGGTGMHGHGQFLSGGSGNLSIPSRISSPTNTHRRNELLTSSFRSSHSGHSSFATHLSVGISTGHVPRQLDAQLRFKYSGGEGLQEGYCRQCAISFNVELLPSAQITNWDVLSAEIPSQFYLVLDVVNLTAQEMSLNYTSNKTILIEAKESCRVPVPVQRCPLERILAAVAEHQHQQQQQHSIGSSTHAHSIEQHHLPSILSGVGGASTGADSTDLTERVCSEHITENVNLKWSLPAIDCSGTASLRGITLSPTMLDLVTVPPLEWEVKVDEHLVAPQSEVTCVTGQFLSFSISICNLSASVLQQVQLSVQFYQDYQNGVQNYRLETRVTMSGPNHILIPSLNKDEKAFHRCSVLFFTPGRFKADIQCRSLSSTQPTPPTARGDDGGAPIMPSVNAAPDSASHVWRFIPPIEITVVDQQ
ncbi:NIK and IKK{beta} binding protein [Anopheles darlingi]|uniref:NIK and IKK(beta) binding protein n=1 Tax=Anopheles darlingi TaxID=43151 RepID=W5J879_ANODA|nr:NIK and IKK{beta} binding protein [Anopheles darlingi]